MLRKRVFFVLLGFLFLTAVASFGNLTTTAWCEDTLVKVLAIDTSERDTQILGALTGIDYTIVTPAQFMSVNLSEYQVLYVPSTFTDNAAQVPSQEALDSLNARQSDIDNFVSSGHGVVALSEPVGTGYYTWLPVAVDATDLLNSDNILISDPTHPVMSGLTDAGLSKWNCTSHNGFNNAGELSVLANNQFGKPVIVAGVYGAGKIVLSGLDADYHYVVNPIPEKQYVQLLQNAINWAAQPAIEIVAIDIKLGSCPNPINVDSKGVLPVVLPGSESLDVNDVDLSSLKLAGVKPVRVNFEDVTAPYTGEESCSTLGADGKMDISLKFDTQEVAATIDSVNDGDVVNLKLTGMLNNGMLIEGTDLMLVIKKKQ